MLEVKWTGDYPNLCRGELVITFNEKKLEIPRDRVNYSMDTYSEYESWSFNEDLSEEWESYYDGLKEKPWIIKNKKWIIQMFEDSGFDKSIVTNELLKDLYLKINAEDWREGS